MHCLYCDRPLALLKRLTGDGDFCSKEHRRIYQQEHNQLALARLLESQPRAGGKGRPAEPPYRKSSPGGERQPVKEAEPPQPEAPAFVPPATPAFQAAPPPPVASRFQMGPSSPGETARGSSPGNAIHLPATRPEP